MREIDTPVSRHRKTFDDHIEVDLDIAIHGQQCETVQTLLASILLSCGKIFLEPPFNYTVSSEAAGTRWGRLSSQTALHFGQENGLFIKEMLKFFRGSAPRPRTCAVGAGGEAPRPPCHPLAGGGLRPCQQYVLG